MLCQYYMSDFDETCYVNVVQVLGVMCHIFVGNRLFYLLLKSNNFMYMFVLCTFMSSCKSFKKCIDG